MNSPRPKVLLVPEGSLYLAFRLPLLFRKAGWDVDLLCLTGDPMAHSRYVSTAFQEKTWKLLSVRLEKILRDPHRLWQAVIVANEPTVHQLMASGDDEILKGWQPGALKPDARAFSLGKFAFAAACRRRQFLIPPSRVCHTVAEVLEFGCDSGWPIIVKPPHQSGGVGIVQYHSPEEMTAGHASLVFPVLAQEFIQGSCGVVDMLCSAGRPLAWLASYPIKRNGGKFGPSTARLFRAMPELQPLVEQLAQSTRFEGFCGFDWIKEDGTGQYYLIEFHPRPPPGFRFGRFCGVDFSAAITAWLKGDVENFPTLVQPSASVIAAHYFSCDFFRCLRQCDWQGLKQWLPGSGACHDVFWDDAPLLATWARQCCRRFFQGRVPSR
jgi:hypothetical protein